MAKSKTSNANQKAHYSTYKSEERHTKNKLRKLERHVSKKPNDEQAAKALGILLELDTVPYTRNRRAIKPNDTIQLKVRRCKGFSPNRNTFYSEIIPKVPDYALKKA